MNKHVPKFTITAREARINASVDHLIGRVLHLRNLPPVVREAVQDHVTRLVEAEVEMVERKIRRVVRSPRAQSSRRRQDSISQGVENLVRVLSKAPPDGLTAKEIADQIAISPCGVTATVTRAQRQGIRITIRRDRPAYRYFLTP